MHFVDERNHFQQTHVMIYQCDPEQTVYQNWNGVEGRSHGLDDKSVIIRLALLWPDLQHLLVLYGECRYSVLLTTVRVEELGLTVYHGLHTPANTGKTPHAQANAQIDKERNKYQIGAKKTRKGQEICSYDVFEAWGSIDNICLVFCARKTLYYYYYYFYFMSFFWNTTGNSIILVARKQAKKIMRARITIITKRRSHGTAGNALYFNPSRLRFDSRRRMWLWYEFTW